MKFNIKKNNHASEISDYISQESSEEIDQIIINFKTLKEDAHKIALYCLTEELTKPTAIYNLIFCVELNLKYYLLISSNLDITQVEKIGHNINNLIKEIKNNKKDNFVDIDSLNNLLNQFKTTKNKPLDMSEYENFKYNKQKNSKFFIFNNYEISQKEKENIKGVLEWLNLHI